MEKLTIRALLLAAAAVFVIAPAVKAQPAVDVNVSIGGFYDELAPYGQWIDCSYGHCWVPARVAADWQPYTNGQWIYTQYGWTWVSDDPWGGSPYHYGTWVSVAGYGWSWVPGTVWAPAWVTWSYSNSYVGWAPLPPTVVFGASGYSGRPIVVRETQYVFVPTNRFVGANVTAVRVPAQQSAAIFRQTRPATGFAVSGGIVRNTALPVTTIERASGHKIEAASVQSARTAPRPAPANFSVVAPPREVKAAVAARPQTANASNAPAGHGNGNAKKSPESSTIETQRPPSEAAAAHRSEPPNQAAPARPAEGSTKQQGQKPKHPPADEKPETQAHHSAQPPAAHQSDSPQKPEAQAAPKQKPHAEADKPEAQANHAPAAHRPPPRPAEPAQKPKESPPKEKPVEKDNKPDAEKP